MSAAPFDDVANELSRKPCMKAPNEIYVNAASSRLLGTVRTKVKESRVAMTSGCLCS